MLAAKELDAALVGKRSERGVDQLAGRLVDVVGDRREPRLAPLDPVAFALPVGDPVAVGDEPAPSQLPRPGLLGLDRGLGPAAPDRLEVLVEVGPQPQRMPLHDPRRLVAVQVLLEALLGAAGARPDVQPGQARIAPATGGPVELDDVDAANGHALLFNSRSNEASSPRERLARPGESCLLTCSTTLRSCNVAEPGSRELKELLPSERRRAPLATSPSRPTGPWTTTSPARSAPGRPWSRRACTGDRGRRDRRVLGRRHAAPGARGLRRGDDALRSRPRWGSR